MPRLRKRPPSAPANVLPATHANPEVTVASPGAGQHAKPAQPHDSGAIVSNEATHSPAVPIGVGLDTSRYGHHASFLNNALEDADDDLDFVESGAGYQQFRARLDALAAKTGRTPPICLAVRRRRPRQRGPRQRS